MRGNVICYVALDNTGNVVGYVDASIYEALDGGRTADMGLLAIDPEHQGKGLGKALMGTVVGALSRLGVRRIVLDSVSCLERFYSRFGFREYRRWVTIRTPIQTLQQELPSLERWR
ncbi:GNAT family N-acetyltransferase [Hyperthermus butylicus]|uniref:GNAT family N-acetyltransferase n=1 Tax=Hyperthermus butylicus TaxID=54248 RepID=UPI00189110F1|nr:GNAT family N-acetyltransferase [Hyperthermus butylicus]